MPPPEPPTNPALSPLDLAVFLVELLLLAVLAVAGARWGSQAWGVVLAVLLPLLAATVWGLYLAPRASRRLTNPARLAAKLGLVVAASALLAVSGASPWALAFLVVAGAVFVAGERGTTRSERAQRLPG